MKKTRGYVVSKNDPVFIKPEDWVVQIDRTTGKERDDYNYLYCKEHGLPCTNSYNKPNNMKENDAVEMRGDGNRRKDKSR